MDVWNFIGKSAGPQKIEYHWRDTALYALAVGAHKKDLLYTYEKQMKAIPSFGVVPYWSAVNNYPQRSIPYPASVMVLHAFDKENGGPVGGLHMEHEIIMHRPIDPIKGSFVFEDTITDVFDRGEGKGIIVRTNMPVYDEAGNLVCENNSSTLIFAGGGFGGKQPPKNTVEIPAREPDYKLADAMSEVQNVLYRLTGDTNHLHVNPDEAKRSGFPEPIMQGLCSFGFACRMGIEAVIPGEPERMVRMSAQMRNVCYPGSALQFVGWETEKGKIVFRLLNGTDRTAILDKGVFCYRV